MATVLLDLLYHKEHKKTMYKPFFPTMEANLLSLQFDFPFAHIQLSYMESHVVQYAF